MPGSEFGRAGAGTWRKGVRLDHRANAVAWVVAGVVALGGGLVPGRSRAEGAVDLPAFSAMPPGTPGAGWTFATLPRKTPTSFQIVEQGGAHVLKVEASDSYGNLIHPVQTTLTEHATLAWRWRVDQLVEGADLKKRDGDDAPLKLCVFFAFDTDKLPLGERTRLALARGTTGQDVPAETLCYVWDNLLPPETLLPSAFTRRVRQIVLQSGPSRLGQWQTQRRSLQADYQKAFGDESEGRTPAVSGIAVSADADNTHAHGLGYMGDIVLTP